MGDIRVQCSKVGSIQLELPMRQCLLVMRQSADVPICEEVLRHVSNGVLQITEFYNNQDQVEQLCEQLDIKLGKNSISVELLGRLAEEMGLDPDGIGDDRDRDGLIDSGPEAEEAPAPIAPEAPAEIPATEQPAAPIQPEPPVFTDGKPQRPKIQPIDVSNLPGNNPSPAKP